MPTTEALFLGDMHLGSMANLFPELLDPDMLIYQAMEPALEYARQHNINHIFLLGDIFDNPEPTQLMVVKLLMWLKKLGEEFDVWFIPGNHDVESDVASSLEVTKFFLEAQTLDRVHFFPKPERVEIEGVPFCFLPWPHKSKKAAGLAAGPSFNIAHVGHVGAVMDNGRKIPDGKGAVLSAKNDIWIVGHLHRCQDINGRVLYPGTMFQKNFGEPLPKGFLHAKLRFMDGKLDIRPKFIKTDPPFVLENLRIETAADLVNVLPYAVAQATPLLRYKLFVHADVALPDNFRQNNPHVVKLDGWTSKREAEALERGDLVLFDENDRVAFATVKDIIYRDLTPALKEHGLNKQERKRARSIVDSIVQKLGIPT